MNNKTIGWILLIIGGLFTLQRTGILGDLSLGFGSNEEQEQEAQASQDGVEISRQIEETVSRRTARRIASLQGDMQGLRESITGQFAA